jgi:hypothetical protein
MSPEVYAAALGATELTACLAETRRASRATKSVPQQPCLVCGYAIFRSRVLHRADLGGSPSHAELEAKKRGREKLRTRSADIVHTMRASPLPIRRAVGALFLFVVFGACSGKSSLNTTASGQRKDEADGGASRNVETGGPVGEGKSTSATPDEEAPSGPPAVQFIGRFDTEETFGPRCSWPGCRIRARFNGTSVSARLKEIDEVWMEGCPSEWDVAIDGVWQPKLVLSPDQENYVLATGLAAGDHLVELYKRSEAQNGTTQFLGYDFGGGTLLAPPPRKKRHIEVIGDSAAAGFGIEGVGLGPDCPGVDWASRWQNFRLSLGVRLAEELNAEIYGSVYSGKGMAQNIWPTDLDTMPVIFPRTNPIDKASKWDFSAYVPDAVIIMMGGNDFAIGQPVDHGPASLADFTDAYDGFVAMVREKYPLAHVFLITSPSVSDEMPAGRNSRTNVKAGIATVLSRRAAAGDTRVYGFEPPVAFPAELTGCNGHGTPEFHQRVADQLAVPIREKLGW